MQRRFVDLAGHEGLSDAARQDEGELARLGLLVAAHVLDQPAAVPGTPIVAADAAQPHRQADRRQMLAHAHGILRRAEAELGREIEGQRHAGAHRLAMQQVGAEAGLGLERMAEGMAEIEQRAQVGGLALVGGHDARLGTAALLDRVGALGRVARQHRGAVLLAPCPERRIVDQPVLRDLGIARQQLAPGQGVEHLGVGQHQPRLVEGADQVLAMARVDAGLAADRGIDLRQQGGRHLDEVDAAQQRRGGKAGEIADHAAAQRDQRRLAVGPLVEQRIHQLGRTTSNALLLSPAGRTAALPSMPAFLNE